MAFLIHRSPSGIAAGSRAGFQAAPAFCRLISSDGSKPTTCRRRLEAYPTIGARVAAGLKLCAWLFLGLGCAEAPATEAPAVSRSLEYKVKAAYLFNFAKYVE